MTSIINNKRKINYTLKRSKRKTIGISVDILGNVAVKAPYFVSEASISQLVENKLEWILSKLEVMEQLRDKQIHRSYLEGEEFYYLGKALILKIIENKAVTKPYINITETELIVNVKDKETELIKKCINDWYKTEAEQIIGKRLSYYSRYIKNTYIKVSYRNTKTCWGSCTSKGNLMFNYKSIMAPIEIVDYLVVHEMSHLVHLNHSKQFWELVESIILDYNKRKVWLKNNSGRLVL